MKKIVFLDVDGVLNHKDMNWNHQQWPLDPVCVQRMKRIIAETGCIVVLSSTWRKIGGAEPLEQAGIPIHDITGSCCSGIRGVEIYNWIGKNYRHDEREQVAYAILDDDSDMLLWQKDHFFQTSFNHGGLTEEITEKVIAHLNV